MTQRLLNHSREGRVEHITLSLQCDRCTASQEILVCFPPCASVTEANKVVATARESANWRRVYGFDICPECQETEETADV